MPPPSKRRKTSAVEEVIFDPAARADYLTGFHKRKQARIKHAQEIAVKREKEEKRRDREELRKRRQEQLEEHVKAVNESIKMANGDEDGEEEEEEETQVGQWHGLGEETAINGKDEEYVDEDQYATVTVEAVDITRDGFVAHGDSDDDDDDADDGDSGVKEKEEQETVKTASSQPVAQKKKNKPWQKNKPLGDRPKRKKKRNFKYEGKDDRRLNRARERSKHKAHATARKSRG